jgi:hypothetical protein
MRRDLERQPGCLRNSLTQGGAGDEKIGPADSRIIGLACFYRAERMKRAWITAKDGLSWPTRK